MTNDISSTQKNPGAISTRARWYMALSVTLLAAPAGFCETPTTQQKLPCDVETVLKSRCQTCHSNPPTAGAPMPLVTYADTQADSPQYPGQKIWQRMKARINDSPLNPMPPIGYPLAQDEKDKLNFWFLGNAPAGDGSSTCQGTGGTGGGGGTGGNPGCDTGPECLPCTPNKFLRAHREPAAGNPNLNEKFDVPQAANEYLCFNFTAAGLGIGNALYATAWAPVIDNGPVVHHWILYGTNSTAYAHGSITPNCEIIGNDATNIAGWAPGGNNTVLDPDVAANLRFNTYRLQVHYSAAATPNAKDASGVAFCTQDTPRTNTAGVIRLGTTFFGIPAQAQNHAVSSDCGLLSFGDVTIVGTSPHMHLLGKGFRTQHIRGGVDIGDISNIPLGTWNFDNQRQYPLRPRRVFKFGDVLRTTCTFSNPYPRPVGFGADTEDEMCFDFILAYPYAGLPKTCGPQLPQ